MVIRTPSDFQTPAPPPLILFFVEIMAKEERLM
jgi:hypothetical protein